MLNDAVSIGDAVAGRMISGLVALSMDHPFALACILAALMGAIVAVLLDAVGPRQASTATEARPSASSHSSAASSSAACAAAQPAKTPRHRSAAS